MFVVPFSKFPLSEGGDSEVLKFIATPACRICERQLVVEYDLEVGYSDPETVACPVCGSYCINDNGETAIIGSTSTPRVKGWLQLNDQQHEIAWVCLDSPSETLAGVMQAHLAAHDFSKSYTRLAAYLLPSHLKRGSGWPPNKALSQLTSSNLSELQDKLRSSAGSRALLGDGLPVVRSESIKHCPEQQKLSELARQSLQVLRQHTRPSLGSVSKLPLRNIQPLIPSSQMPLGKRVSWDSSGLSQWVTDTRPSPLKRTPQRQPSARRKAKTVKRRNTRTR